MTIKINMPIPSQEPPLSFRAPNQNLEDMDVLCSFKIKIESQNLQHWCIKDLWPYPNQVKMWNPSPEPITTYIEILTTHPTGHPPLELT